MLWRLLRSDLCDSLCVGFTTLRCSAQSRLALIRYITDARFGEQNV